MTTSTNSVFTSLAMTALVLLAACSKTTPPSPNAATTTAAAPPCADEAGIRYLCGVINGEDILPLGDTGHVIVSGMNGQLSNDAKINGKLHLVDAATKNFSIWFPGDKPAFEQNKELFGACPGPIDASNLSAHGIALKAVDAASKQYRLYLISHGAREAVEIFDIDASGAPTIKWIGCVPMPATSWTNSVAILKDWGFVATQFMDPTGTGMQGVRDHKITGQVFEWHPGADVKTIAGTELSGPNGILVSDDERYLYVAAFGTAEVVRFDRHAKPIAKQSVKLAIAPDNLRWSGADQFYAAGGVVTDTCGGPECGAGWAVAEIDAHAMTAKTIASADDKVTLKGISSAQAIGNEIWVGTYRGDRIGILPKP